MSVIEKTPNEKYTITVDFEDRLPTGATVSSGTVGAIDLSNGQSTEDVIGSTTATVTTTTAAVVLQAGTANKDYKITFTVTLSNSNILEEVIELRVRESYPPV